MNLSNRAKAISDSVTLAITAKAKQLKAQGEPIISFGAGEPDFDTPDYIKDAAKTAIDQGFTKYTPSPGTLELRKAICNKLKKDNNLEYTEKQIIVSSGAKQSLFNTVMTICNEGDEVIVIAPYWVTYVEQINFANAIPKVVVTKASEDFKINIDDLKSKLTPRTKAIIINSPSNPTGVVYTKEELEAIAKIAIEKDLFVISDEIYEKIIYDGDHISIASLGEDIKRRTIVINGVSKSHSMTGWRIGYAAAEEEIVKVMNKLQSHSTSNANSIAQKAALKAMLTDDTVVNEMVSHFKERRDYIVKALNDISGLSCFNPSGAFYVFPNVSSYFGKNIGGKQVENSLDLCEVLLDKAKVAVVPGKAFGADEYIRLSYALGLDDIKEGVKRIKDLLVM